MSFLGSTAALLRHRVIAATAGTATVVLLAGCAFAATAATEPGPEKLAAQSSSKTAAQPARSGASARTAAPADPLRVVSVTPGPGTGVNGGAPVTVRFSSRLAPSTPLPTLSPAIAGRWKVSGASATFTPSSGYLPGTTVTLTIPGGTGGMQGAAASAGVLARSSRETFTTGSYSTLRLEQVLAQLGYLPLTWTASGRSAGSFDSASMNAQVRAAYDPPAGTFTFTSGYPTALTSQWTAGSSNILVTGAVRAFEYNQQLTMDGIAGPQVWASLLTAAVRHEVNPSGYTYALADQNSPHETLKVWHNGKVILDSPANTGVAGAGTADGTFPVYLRLQFQIMRGTNPDGTKYADPVSWISYFNGGDAVHAFPRASYGYYQSVGCVELPPATGQYIWPYMTYGTLVTVEGPEA